MQMRKHQKTFIRFLCLIISLLSIVNRTFAEEIEFSFPEPLVSEFAETIETAHSDGIDELTYYELDRFATNETGTETETLSDSPEMLCVPYTPLAESRRSIQSLSKSLPLSSGNALTFSGTMSVVQLRKKFPEGKYWNHANNPGAEPERSKPDNWTDIPCPFHDDQDYGYFTSGIVTCNTFYLDGDPLGTQCHGFAAKLAYDVTGQSIIQWNKITDPSIAMAVIKPGDVVRINDDHHTIFIIAVRGEDVMYVDCNNGHQCAIHWNQRTTKHELYYQLTYLRQSPVTLSWGGEGACWCSAEVAGQYITQGSVALKKGHGSDYQTLVTIPAGAVVEVTMGDEQYVHATYQGKSGYLPTAAVSPAGTPPQVIPSWTGCNLSVPDAATFDVNVYCRGNLPAEGFSISTAITENTPNFFRLDFLGWDYTTAKFRITAVAGGWTDLTFRIVDSSNAILAACNFRIYATERPATITTSQNFMDDFDLDQNVSKTITLTGGGYIPGMFSFTLWASAGDNYRIEWVGDWHEKAHDVKITAVRPGAGRAVFALVCNEEVRASVEVYITVQGEIQCYPSFTSVTLSSTVQRALPFSLRFYGNFPDQISIRCEHNTGAFRVENGSWSSESGSQPLIFNITFVPQQTGNDAAIFTLMNQATKEPLAIVCIPVYVIGKPVYLLQYDLRGGDNAPTRHLLAYGSRITDAVPTRNHYTFAGWTDNPRTNVICYGPGSTFKEQKDMTLYAVWGPQLPGNVLRLPENTLNIDCDTFAGAGIQAVVIHENCERVGSRAFADNGKLTVAVFLGKHTIISEDAFDGCQNLLIYGKSGSTADTFATSDDSYTFYPLD